KARQEEMTTDGRERHRLAIDRRGAVVSGHSLGSEAGIAVLKSGGSAIDAAVAASAVLCGGVGHATSFGGDCFVLMCDRQFGSPSGLNASGPAPELATEELFKNGMPQHGSLAPVVPGLVRAWEALHRRGGKLPWRQLFQAAIALAENGF